MQKEVEDQFSLPWQIYRVATHKLGGLHLISDFSKSRTLSDLYDMLEVIDVYDALQEEQLKEIEQREAQKNRQR